MLCSQKERFRDRVLTTTPTMKQQCIKMHIIPRRSRIRAMTTSHANQLARHEARTWSDNAEGPRNPCMLPFHQSQIHLQLATSASMTELRALVPLSLSRMACAQNTPSQRMEKAFRDEQVMVEASLRTEPAELNAEPELATGPSTRQTRPFERL